jgi:hypothetical protein
MLQRAQPVLLFMLVLAVIALLFYAQPWAQNGTADSVDTNEIMFGETILVQYDTDPPSVYFCDDPTIACTGFCDDPYDCPPEDHKWRPAVWTEDAIMCFCIGNDCESGTEYTSLDNNIAMQLANEEAIEAGEDPPYDVDVSCHRIVEVGPGDTGCPLITNGLPALGYRGGAIAR